MKTAKELELSLLLKESHIQQLNLKIEELTNDLEREKSQVKEYGTRLIKAREYIDNLSNEPNVFGHYGIDGNCKKYLLDILKGVDKE